MWNLCFVLGAFIISSIFSLHEKKEIRKTNDNVYWFIIVLLILCVTFRDGSTLKDYEGYVDQYNSADSDYIIEPSFLYIKSIASAFGSYYILFFVYAVLSIGFKSMAIARLTQLKFLTLCVYISNILILQDMTQIRAGVASGIFLFSIPYLQDRKMIKYVGFILLAAFFHYSALLFFLCCLLWVKRIKNNQYFLWIIIPLGYIFCGIGLSNLNFIPYEPLRYKLEVYKTLKENGTTGFTDLNIFNPYILFRIFLYYILLWKKNLIVPHNTYFETLIFIEAIAITIFPLFSFIPLLGYRGSELLGIVEILLYPFFIYVIKPMNYGRAVVIGIGLLLLAVNLTYKALIEL